MKNKLLSILMVVAVMVFVSCEKDSYNGNGIPTVISSYNNSKVHISHTNNVCYSIWENSSDTPDQVKLNYNETTTTVTVNQTIVAPVVKYGSSKWIVQPDESVTIPAGTTLNAIYPSNATFNSNGTISLTIPAEQNYEVVSGTQKIYAPMFAQGTNLLTFQNLCALLEIQVPANTFVQEIKVTTIEGDALLAGDAVVTIANDGTASLSIVDNNNAQNTITLQVNAARADGIYYIYIPAVSNNGNHVKVSITYRDGSVDANSPSSRYYYHCKSIWQSSATGIAAGDLGVISFTFNENREYLNGIFSVSSSKKVMFSRGNLLWTGGYKTNLDDVRNSAYWVFNTNQWDMGEFVAFSSTSTQTNSNYFSFNTVTSNTTLLVENNGHYQGNFEDWGSYMNTNNDAHWMTLSAAEWTYLISGRTLSPNTNPGYGFCRVQLPGSENYMNGMILFPDKFTAPSGITIPTTSARGTYTSTTATYTYTIQQWSELENAGCVFLPAGGKIEHSGSHSNPSPNSEGTYWTTTRSNGNKANYFMFNGSGDISYEAVQCGTGHYVRLVYAIDAVE